MQFAEIIGQEQIKGHLQNALKTRQVSHAYLMEGEALSGKRSMAQLFAKSLLCTDLKKHGSYLEPCGTCTSCLQADAGTHPDLKIVHPEKESGIGVDDIRFQVRDDSYIKPYASPYKVYVLPDADRMTVQAQNALLKTLEEPPAYVVMLLLATNAAAFLPTITSRCVLLPLRPVADDDIGRYLMETCKVPDYKAHLAVSFARGNVGRARLLSQSDAFEEHLRAVIGILSEIGRLRIDQMNERIRPLLEAEEDRKRAAEAFSETVRLILRDVLLYKTVPDVSLLVFAGEMSYIKKACDAISYEGAGTILKAIDTLERRIRANVNAEIALQLFLMTLKENCAI